MSIGRKLSSILTAIILALSTSTLLAPEASAGIDVSFKIGVPVSEEWIYNDTRYLDCTWKHERVSMCIRFDRRTIYVLSNKADGYDKYGQSLRKYLGYDNLRYYRCKNDTYRWSKGWVGCHWDWPNTSGWSYDGRSGYGQSDWLTWTPEQYWMPRHWY